MPFFDDFESVNDDPELRNYLIQKLKHNLANDPCASHELKFAVQKADFDELFDEFPLLLAPGVADVIQAKRPPPFKYFQTLPDVSRLTVQEKKDHYLCYLASLKKGSRGRPYVGSASKRTNGSKSRLEQWSAQKELPLHVRAALKEGFKIKHQGVLVSIQKPDFTIHPLARCFILLLEEFFMFTFWTIHQGVGKDSVSFTWASDFCP